MRAQPPVSQSSMSQNINGRMSKTVTLIMPVVGGSGRMAQVRRWGGLCAGSGSRVGCPFVLLGGEGVPCAAGDWGMQHLMFPPPQPCLQAQVQYVEGGSAAEQLTIAVRLPNGQVINLDGSSMAAGKVVDVEWREVDK